MTHGWPCVKTAWYWFSPSRAKHLLAALEQAVDVLVAEVPAAVALAQVAAERAHVADLRPADLAGRRRQRRAALAQLGVVGDVGQLDAGADGDRAAAPARRSDAVEVAVDAGQADDLVRLGDVLLLQVEQVGAAGQQFGLAPLARRAGRRPARRSSADSR